MTRRIAADSSVDTVDVTPERVLLAGTEPDYATTLAHFLTSEGFQVDRCHDSQGVLRLVGVHSYQVVVLDLDLAEGAGLDVITFIHRQQPTAQVVLLFDVPQVEKAIEGIRRVRAPLLLIAGEDDRHTPLADSQRLFDAAPHPKHTWIVPGAAHVDFHRFAPAEYERRVLEFFGRTL